jgi:hypothetical protein
MEKSKLNPIAAGLLNMLVPGSINIFFKKGWKRFLLTFVGMEIVLAIVIWVGISLQGTRSFNVPQGLCPGALSLVVLVPLFLNGFKTATENNKIQSDKALYQSRKPESADNDDEQLKKIQTMRDEGLISKQQYEARKGKIGSKK